MNKLFEDLKARFPDNVLGLQRRIDAHDFEPFSLITVDGVVTEIRLPLESLSEYGYLYPEKDQQVILEHFTEKIKKIIT
jgi:hypothetical protein